MTALGSHTLEEQTPIIIIGMHRSGTSMITRVLEKLGLFVGDEKQDDHESIFFLNLNDHFLSTINQHWDHLERTPIQWNETQQHELASVALKKFKSRQLFHYNRSADSAAFLSKQWGWKDPRNTLTFDIWKQIFPKAKVVHIFRNPIDVAVSLRSRYIRSQGIWNMISRMKVKLPRSLQRLNWESRVKHEWNPAALTDLNYGIELSRKYLSAAEQISNSLPVDQYYEMCYERFLDDPLTFITQIVDFIGLKPSKEEIQESLESLDVSRKFAFASDQEMLSVYGAMKDEPWMKKWGYDDIV